MNGKVYLNPDWGIVNAERLTLPPRFPVNV